VEFKTDISIGPVTPQTPPSFHHLSTTYLSFRCEALVVEAQLHLCLSWKSIFYCKPVSIYNELQILYTKERFQKVPETSTGSQRRLDFPTALAYVECSIVKREQKLVESAQRVSSQPPLFIVR